MIHDLLGSKPTILPPLSPSLFDMGFFHLYHPDPSDAYLSHTYFLGLWSPKSFTDVFGNPVQPEADIQHELE